MCVGALLPPLRKKLVAREDDGHPRCRVQQAKWYFGWVGSFSHVVLALCILASLPLPYTPPPCVQPRNPTHTVAVAAAATHMKHSTVGVCSVVGVPPLGRASQRRPYPPQCGLPRTGTHGTVSPSPHTSRKPVTGAGRGAWGRGAVGCGWHWAPVGRVCPPQAPPALPALGCTGMGARAGAWKHPVLVHCVTRVAQGAPLPVEQHGDHCGFAHPGPPTCIRHGPVPPSPHPRVAVVVVAMVVV